MLNIDKFEKYINGRCKKPKSTISYLGSVCCGDDGVGISSWTELIKYYKDCNESILRYAKNIQQKRKLTVLCEFIYRSEYAGKWRNGFWKKVNPKYYFAFLWSPKKLDTTKLGFKKTYGVLYKKACLRRIMKPSAGLDDLLYSMALDLHGNYNTIEDKSSMISTKIGYIICKKVMKLTVREILEAYKDTIENLMKLTMPKSGIIINNKVGHSAFKKSTGAAKARKLIRIIKFNEVYDETLGVKENLKLLEKEGLKISSRTFLRYKKLKKELSSSSTVVDLFRKLV